MFDRVVSLTHLNLDRLELGSSSWGTQFRDAMSVNGGDVENATTLDYIMHFFTFAWKVNRISVFAIYCSRRQSRLSVVVAASVPWSIC